MYSKILRRATLLFFIPFASSAQQKGMPVIITIDAANKAQVMENFGAAGCWNAEGIGKYWPKEKKERIAELLFSREMTREGNPKGIGLSAWRFNIGAGTTEQGDSSGMPSLTRRVECFQNADGTYDWNKQEGYVWFVKKAKTYGVKDLIAFVNSPPVHMTKNGFGYKTEEDYLTNLKADKYVAYADFLTDVLKHFQDQGINFNYISPVNEPQWKWLCKFGDADQEGSPYTNKEIFQVVKTLDSSLTAKKISSNILMTEAGTLTYLYGSGRKDNKLGANQIQQFRGKNSPYYVGNLSHVPNMIGGHSYFTEGNDSTLLAVRTNVADTAKNYDVNFWQTEYCMLDDGFREGAKEKRSAIDCALFLSKVIHHDLTIANATAWQFWNAFEPGKTDFDLRYYLIALQPNKDNSNGEYKDVKTLWALGHYSLFVRPGMHRLPVSLSNGLSPEATAQNLMVSSFADDKGKLVIVLNNYTKTDQVVSMDLKNFKKAQSFKGYITTAEEEVNMKVFPVNKNSKTITLPAKSIITLTAE